MKLFSFWLRVVLFVALINGCAEIQKPASVRIGEIHEITANRKTSNVASKEITTCQRLAETELNLHPLNEYFLLEFHFPGGGPGGAVEAVVEPTQAFLRVFKSDLAIVARVGERRLDPSESMALRKFVTDNHIDQMTRQEFGAFDGVEYRWTHLSHSTGWQVILNNPTVEQHAQQELLQFMRKLQDAKPLGVGDDLEIPVNAYADAPRIDLDRK